MKIVHLITEAPDSNLKVYVDMDGVLTDMERHFKDHDLDIKDHKVWDLIKNEMGAKFWVNMPWMPDGKQLWNGVKGLKPTILSAPPEMDDKPAIEGKKEWVKRELGNVPCIIEKRKEKYARPNTILIDDRMKVIEPWRQAGGIGILHTSATATLRQLRELMGSSA